MGKRVGKYLFYLLFVGALLILLTRIVLIFMNREDGAYARWVTIIVISICVLLYVLFIVEGLMVSALRLKDADRDQLGGFLADTADNGADVVAISDLLKAQYDRFVIGRSLVSVTCVVGIAQLIDQLRFIHSNTPSGEDSGVAISDPFWIVVLFSPIVSVLLAAAISYWVALVLPHVLAHRRPIGFMQWSFAKAFIGISVGLSNYGAGAPSLLLFRFFTRWSKGEEHIGVGDAQIYESLVNYFGSGVHERLITIECKPETTTVTDQVVQEYRHGKHTALRHMVHIPKDLWGNDGDQNLGAARRWTPEPPSGVSAVAMETKAVLHRLHELPLTWREEPISESTVLECAALLSRQIPRIGAGPEKGSLTVTYQLRPLRTDDRSDEILVEISKPTRRITVRVIPVGIQLVEPDATFHPSELTTIGKPPTIEHVRPRVVNEDDRWLISMDYPPIASRLRILLDAWPLGDINSPV